MSYPLCRELLIDALQTAGVRSSDEPVQDADITLALRYLNNDVIDQLRIHKLWPHFVKDYKFTTSGSIQEYSIGVPLALPAPQPDCALTQEVAAIEWAQVLIGTVWQPLRQISAQDHYRTVQATTTVVVPIQFSFNRSRDPYARFVLSQPAAGGYQIRIAVMGPVPNYKLDDQIDLPSGYYSCLKYALAALLADLHGLDQVVLRMEKKYGETLDRIKDTNVVEVPKLKLGGGRSMYNPYSDQVLSTTGGL